MAIVRVELQEQAGYVGIVDDSVDYQRRGEAWFEITETECDNGSE